VGVVYSKSITADGGEVVDQALAHLVTSCVIVSA
jgi:hypothetical protein